ncbi:hypothetical protein BJY52DRAFT_1111116 [Lactarius psammicola]|nr:hypothetical protein BJY52DRAFT_1111116 [Lactarius psammicola]
MPVPRISHWRSLATRRRSSQPSTRRFVHRGGDSGSHEPSRHAQFYSDLLPAMVPVALLGSAVYMGLQLLQTYLAHEKYLDDARARVQELEREIDALVLERRNTSFTPAREAASDAAVHATNFRGWFGRLWRGQ